MLDPTSSRVARSCSRHKPISYPSRVRLTERLVGGDARQVQPAIRFLGSVCPAEDWSILLGAGERPLPMPHRQARRPPSGIAHRPFTAREAAPVS